MRRQLAGLASLVLVLVVVVVIGIDGVEGYRGKMVGARREVKDVKSNKEIQDLGRFSVSEFNAKLGDDKQKEQLLLNFQEVVEAQTQVVSGIKYYLKILAAPLHNSNEKQLYDAAVVVKPWLNRGSLTLLHFRPSCTATTKAAV